MRSCNYCGKENDDALANCAACGCPLVESDKKDGQPLRHIFRMFIFLLGIGLLYLFFAYGIWRAGLKAWMTFGALTGLFIGYGMGGDIWGARFFDLFTGQNSLGGNDKKIKTHKESGDQTSRWKWNKQRSVKQMRATRWMFSILAVLSLGMNFALSPNPFGNAKIDDFSISKCTIIDAKIIEKTAHSRYSSNKYYELDVNTSSAQMFHLCRPDTRSQLALYLAALPIGKEVSIRYFNDFNGYEILDVRNENQIFIPFSEVMTDNDRIRNYMLILTGVFAILGAIGFWFSWGKQKHRGTSKHSQAYKI